jgi:hypothetical protein
MKGTFPMTRASQGVLIAILAMSVILTLSVAIFGLTSKSYLERYIVLQGSSGQVPQVNVWPSTNAIQSQPGQSEGMKISPAPTTPRSTKEMLNPYWV